MTDDHSGDFVTEDTLADLRAENRRLTAALSEFASLPCVADDAEVLTADQCLHCLARRALDRDLEDVPFEPMTEKYPEGD